MPKKPTSQSNNTQEVLVYGVITPELVAQVAQEIKFYETIADQIDLHFNTPGGSINDGIALYNVIKGCKVPVYGYIDGVAASMGCYCALACKKLFISKYGRMMLHEGQAPTGGTAEEMRDKAEMLDGHNADLVAITMARTGMAEGDVKAKFFDGSDHWVKARDAKKMKLVDDIYDLDEVDVPEAASHLELYAMVAELQFDNPIIQQFKNKNSDMEHNMTPEALAELGLTAKATPIEINAALMSRNNLLSQKLKDQDKAVKTKEVDTLLSAALDEKKIDAQFQAVLKAQYDTNPEGLKAILDKMPSFRSVNEALNTEDVQRKGGKKAYSPQVKALMEKGFKALDRSGEMAQLYAMDQDAYRELYKGQFGCYPNERVRDMGLVARDVATAKAQGNVITP